MMESVVDLRSRWTPETTAAAVRYLQGLPGDFDFGTVEQDGHLYVDLRGLSVTQAQLDGAVIKNASLRWSQFTDVGFKDARLETCNLSHTNFNDCYFRRTHFYHSNLTNAKFENCDFSNANLDHSRLDFATFKLCEIRLDSIHFRDDANPLMLVRVCRNLKLNAMSMGHFADAGELTYLEMSYDRRVLFREAFHQRHGHLHVRMNKIFAWLGSVLLNWLWGYGEKPARLLLALLVDIVFFGTLQYWLNGIPGKPWWEVVYFSGITFLTIGYGDLSPVGFLPRFLAILEGASGVAVTGLLIASFTKKIMYR